MSWLTNILFPPSMLFNHGKKQPSQKDMNLQLAEQVLSTFLKQQASIGQSSFDFGMGTLKEAKGDVDYLQDFFKNILEGNDKDSLLEFLDSEGIDNSYANAERTANELAPAGGARASTLGNLSFAKAGDIQKALMGVKQQAPSALMQLAQLMSGISGTSLQTSANAYNLGSNLLNVPLGLKESELERRNRLIGGLISAGGTITGALIP